MSFGMPGVTQGRPRVEGFLEKALRCGVSSESGTAFVAIGSKSDSAGIRQGSAAFER
jgi:hypothetical protein